MEQTLRQDQFVGAAIGWAKRTYAGVHHLEAASALLTAFFSRSPPTSRMAFCRALTASSAFSSDADACGQRGNPSGQCNPQTWWEAGGGEPPFLREFAVHTDESNPSCEGKTFTLLHSRDDCPRLEGERALHTTMGEKIYPEEKNKKKLFVSQAAGGRERGQSTPDPRQVCGEESVGSSAAVTHQHTAATESTPVHVVNV